MKKSIYKGELTKPAKEDSSVSRRKILAAYLKGDKDKANQISKECFDEDNRKLQLLCEHYEIPEDFSKYYFLAIALAREFVPCLKIKNKKGAKEKWTWQKRQDLFDEIEQIRGQKGSSMSIKQACKELAKKTHWRDFVITQSSTSTTGDQADTLRQIYQLHKREMKNLRALLNKSDT
jgi:hypothetical protein